MSSKYQYNILKLLNLNKDDESSQFNEIVCKDNNIHIRLRRYGDRKELISGFKDKLTFLMTYLINEYCTNNLMNKESFKNSLNANNYSSMWKECLSKFKESKEFSTILSVCENHYQCNDLKGINILPLYTRKFKKENAFDTLGECVNLSIDSQEESIEKFLHYFNLELCTNNSYIILCDEGKENQEINNFLFNDNICILISHDIEINTKKRKFKKEPYKLTNLW